MSFAIRSIEKEIIDLRKLTPEETASVYPLIARVNRRLGGTRVILHYLEEFSRRWDHEKIIRILDVGTGVADIPAAILRWAKQKKIKIHITALDIDSENLTLAKHRLDSITDISFVQASSMQLPFAEQSFDYVMASLFFHHLSDEEIIQNLKNFDHLAKQGIIINDLVRSPAAYAGFFLFSLAAGRNAIFRHDGLLSVKRSFRLAEARQYIEKAGLSYLKPQRHFAFRMAIAGQKP